MASIDFNSNVDVSIAGANAALKKGDISETETICRRLIGEAPGDGRPWALLAETALLRNRADAATICAARAVALAPDDLLARVIQAKCLLASGDIGEALDVAERAATLPHSSPEARDGLGAIFSLLGRHQQALDLFSAVCVERADIAQFRFNLASTQRMLGRLDDAETQCDEAIAINPHYAPAYYLRSDLRIQTPLHNHIGEIEAALSGGLDWRSDVLLRYALSKEYEDIDAHAQAFAHVSTAASNYRHHMNYDVQTDVAEIDAVIAAHNTQWLASAPAGFSGAAPVFVAGLPRTGTTLVERIIASHSAMTSVGETGLFAIEARRALQSTATNRSASPMELGERYIDTTQKIYGPGDKNFVDKTLTNYLYCGLIHAALPQAKIILIRRHPLDTAWALYKAHFQGSFLFSYALDDIAEYYLAYHRLCAHWASTLPAQSFLEVAYEDVVRDQARESRRIIEFLGLPWEDGVLRFHESTAASSTASAVQIRRPIYASSVEKWRRHAKELTPAQKRLANVLGADALA